MRVKELADLTDTTVRTIRYYHQIGLLPVPEAIAPALGRHVEQRGAANDQGLRRRRTPEERGGSRVRDYGMAHLARLLRIRWLVDSGVPLAAVRSMLEEQADDPDELAAIRTDLAIALSGIDERLEQLKSQRNQLIRLLRTTADGGPVSPMPRPVHRMYEQLLARAADDEISAVIAAERQVVELACYSGELPPMVIDLAERLTGRQLDLILPLFGEFRDLDRAMSSLPDDEIGRRVDTMARHSVEFVASLGLSSDQVMALLEQVSLSSSDYVGYATTELFPKALQDRFQEALEAGLRQHHPRPEPLKGVTS